MFVRKYSTKVLEVVKLLRPSARLVARHQTLQIRKNEAALIHSSLESIVIFGHFRFQTKKQGIIIAPGIKDDALKEFILNTLNLNFNLGQNCNFLQICAYHLRTDFSRKYFCHDQNYFTGSNVGV